MFAGRPNLAPHDDGCILVGLFGTPADTLAVRLAERLAPPERLKLVRVVEIPRDLSLPSSIENRTESERRRLRLGKHSQTSLTLSCCRNPGKQLLESINTLHPRLVLVALTSPADDSQQALLRWILRESNTEMLIVQGNSSDTTVPPSHVSLPVRYGQNVPQPILQAIARLGGPHGTVDVVGSLLVPRSMAANAPLINEETQLSTHLQDILLRLQNAGAKTSSRIVRFRDTGDQSSKLPVEPSDQTMLLAVGDSESDDESFLTRCSIPTPGVQVYWRTIRS